MGNAAPSTRTGTDANGDPVLLVLTGFRVDPFVAMAKLDALGSAEQIAAYFRAEHLVGAPGLALRCPLARYLLRETGVQPSVGMHDWAPRRHNDPAWMPYFPLSAQVEQFVEDVDLGRYPELVCHDGLDDEVV